jgi:cation diffusion facilitator CzcD-associated flavoprotein CzcO
MTRQGRREPDRSRVAVIGAGLGGVLMAVKLKQAGYEDFTVFERESGPGGVWWKNTYPGCEVDVPSAAYSYSFLGYDWSRTHARQPELREYVRYVIERYRVAGHFQYGVAVKSAHWNVDTATYTVEAESGSMGEFDVVVSALGMLSDPRIPSWPGLKSFGGPVFHTSAYEHQHDLAGKRVAVVGTGSTACQLVPALAPVVGQLDLYQREPGYVLPKRDREYTSDERAGHARSRLRQRVRRLLMIREAQKLGVALDVKNERNRTVREYCLHVIGKAVRDPATRAAVTPDYAYGCKRPIIATTFYPALNQPNVSLIPHAVQDITQAGVLDETGVRRPADVVVLATGFQATNYLASVDVHGLEGRSLHEVWGEEPTAFLGITVAGFPNFFILYGPNTNGGWSVITQLEIQAKLVVRMIGKTRPGRVAIDTRPLVADRYDQWVQRGIVDKLSSLAAGCHNYYTAATGKNVTQWPHGHLAYLMVTLVLGPVGLVRRRASAYAAPRGEGGKR